MAQFIYTLKPVRSDMLATGLIMAALLGGPASLQAEETVVIAGAGPSTVVVQEFFDSFATTPGAEGYTFVVPPRSIKHAGGLASTSENIFGRTGRPLTEDERGDHLREIPLARIPLIFVIDPDVGVSALDSDQLAAILTRQFVNWSELGGADLPIRIVGREPGEAALGVLSGAVPELATVTFDLELKKDHQLVELLGSDDRTGVLGFGARPNFPPETWLKVEGLAVGTSVGLVYDEVNEDNPLVLEVTAYAQNDVWLSKVEELGLLPVEPGI